LAVNLTLFILTFSAALAFALGNILEKIGLSRTHASISLRNWTAFIKSIFKSIPWWSGILLSTYGTLAYYAAMASWNISLVQPLMCLNPVLTAILGRFWLKEELDKHTFWGIFWIISGLLLVGTRVHEAPGHAGGLGLWLFMGISLLALVAASLLKPGHPEFRDGCLTGGGFGLSALIWKQLSMSTLVGFKGDWQSLAITLIKDPLVYAFIVFYVGGFVGSQIALSRGRALFVIPFSAALATFIPILGGWLVFEEPMNTLKFISFILVSAGSLFFVRVKVR
jgi:uncharacterized membrane protein